MSGAGSPSSPSMRASDADRERVVSVLQEAFAQGRITVDEFDERSDQAYAAKTLGDLVPLTADLPAQDLARPGTSLDRGQSGADSHRFGSGSWSPVATGRTSMQRTRELRAIWSTWVTVTTITTVIWLLSGMLAGFSYFWPIWPIGLLGAGALARTINGSGHHDQPQDSQRDRDRHRP
jgi:hypothetical protein